MKKNRFCLFLPMSVLVLLFWLSSVFSFQFPQTNLAGSGHYQALRTRNKAYHSYGIKFERNQALASSVWTREEIDAPITKFELEPCDNRYAASDCFSIIRNMHQSSILKSILVPVVSIMSWSTFLAVIHKGLKTAGFHQIAATMCISHKVHSFLVSAIGLLLVFRTNSAYQRFAEGRIIWEQIHSVSRTMSRMVMLYEKDVTPSRRRRIERLLAAFPYSLHQHIQPQCDPNHNVADNPNSLMIVRPKPIKRRRKDIGDSRPSTVLLVNNDRTLADTCFVDKRSLPWCLFPDSVVREFALVYNRPMWICDRLATEFNEIEYSPNFSSRERLSFLSKVDKLSNSIGECERIHQTAVPLNYARHALRSITFWLATLPFCLIQEFGLATGPVMGLASWLFYGIYQIGFLIEDPFAGTLRLSSLCDAIYRDVMYGTDYMRQRMTAFRPGSEEKTSWAALDLPSRTQTIKHHTFI